MSDITDNQVLLRLVLKGMEPAEVARLANETYGQLKAEAAQHIDALTNYYKQSQQAQTDAAKEAADEKIKAETQALDAVTKLMRQQEIEANRARNAWHGVMEDLENITTVARGAWDVMAGGFERFKSLGEDITKTTNIYGALKGSIDEMREATEGEVADIDLIEAKNRGFQESLRLTDAQYGEVAAAAHDFAKVLGVDTKDALDKLVQGLATGRVRTLEMVGVTVNADEANREYAKSIGKTVDQLTDHDKKNALLQESLRAMDRKIVESGGNVKNFASEWEKLTAEIHNAIDSLELGIGKFVMSAVEGLTITLPGAFQIAIAKLKDLMPGVDQHYEDQARAALGAAYEKFEGVNASKEQVEAAKSRLADPNAYAGASTGFGTDKTTGKQGYYEPFGPDGENRAVGKEHRATFDFEGLFSPRSGDTSAEDYVKAAQAAQDADEKRLVVMEKVKGITVDQAVAYQKLATSLGLEVEQLTHEEKMQALNNEAMVQADKLAIEAKKKADARRAELKSTQEKAGFMGIFLWGTDGPEQTYKEMDIFQQRMVDMTGEVSATIVGAAQQWTSAMGKSVAASIAGATGNQKSIKQITYDTLLGLSEQAAGKAVWEGAEALASAALYDYDAAAKHGAAALAFGALAVTSGLGARAIGAPSASSSSRPTSGMATQSSGPQTLVGSGSSSSVTQQQNGPVTINLSVMPGGEPEAGRAVMRALQALQNQTGQSVQPLIASA